VVLSCFRVLSRFRHPCLEVEWRDDGTIEWEVPWTSGEMNGVARQRDAYGRDLFRSRFVRGRGVDLWVQCGSIVEFREYVSSVPHGVERWGHPMFPTEEGHWIRGKRTGIFRRWSGTTIEGGYPQYFVDDVRVSRGEYLILRRGRKELGPDRRLDDVRKRPFPPSLVGVWLRKSIRLSLGQ
jgi:hypothetical protein